MTDVGDNTRDLPTGHRPRMGDHTLAGHHWLSEGGTPSAPRAAPVAIANLLSLQAKACGDGLTATSSCR